MVLLLTFLLLSAYSLLYFCFVVSFFFAVLCLLTIFLLFNNGSFPRTVRLNNSSAGGTFVDVCGVVLYSRRNLLSSCCYGRFSMCAVFKALPRGCMNLSASALPCGHLGVEYLALIPRTSR